MEFENKNFYEKKLFYLEGIGEGVYQISMETLGSYGEKIFKRIIINKFEEYDPNNLIDYFDIEYVHDESANLIELTCNFTLENVLTEKDVDITNKVIYCQSDENNVQKDYYWSDNQHLPYIKSVNDKIDMCVPKVFNHLYMYDQNYMIRSKKIYIFN